MGHFQRNAFTHEVNYLEIHTMCKFMITLERDEDGMWISECPSITGCISQGETRQDAIANIREAIGLCLAVRAERGMPLTMETLELEVAA